MLRSRFISIAAYLAPPQFRIYLALVVGGLLTTLYAAPYMLSLRSIGDDPQAVQQAFDDFDRWGATRGVLQMIAFPVNVWALVSVLKAS